MMHVWLMHHLVLGIILFVVLAILIIAAAGDSIFTGFALDDLFDMFFGDR